MVEEIQMTCDDAIEYIRNNVKVKDILEVSYNRIYAPGEVLGITEEDEEQGVLKIRPGVLKKPVKVLG